MQFRIRNAALVGALATITVTAWAAYPVRYQSNWIPAPSRNEAPAPAPSEPAAAQQPALTTTPLGAEPVREESLAPKETLAPNETVVTPRAAAATPVAGREGVEGTVVQPPIMVEERRLTEDERIQLQVMDRLANVPGIAGKIGVESEASVVTLTGYTMTAAQAWRAGREAGRISGVRYVQNQLRARIGGSVL